MALAERELGRRLQLVQGIHWLYGAQGDPYAALLRGYGADPADGYARARERGPLWRSRLGTWVCPDHAAATALLALPAAVAGAGAPAAAQPQTALAWDEGLPLPGAAARPDAGRVGELAERAGARLLRELRGEVDLVAAVAARVPVEVLAGLHGLDGADRDRLAQACAAVSGALDAALAPPAYGVAVRLLDAVGALRELLGEEAVRTAVVGARAARELIAGALNALLADPRQGELLAARGPERAPLVVAEALRHDPPVKVHAFVVPEETEVAGERIAAGEQVAVLVGAANRDPGVFGEPDRFDPDRFGAGLSGPGARPLVPAPHGVALEPFARVQAEAVVRALAGLRPGLRAAAPARRLPRSPVTWGLERIPARAGE